MVCETDKAYKDILRIRETLDKFGLLSDDLADKIDIALTSISDVELEIEFLADSTL